MIHILQFLAILGILGVCRIELLAYYMRKAVKEQIILPHEYLDKMGEYKKLFLNWRVWSYAQFKRVLKS